MYTMSHKIAGIEHGMLTNNNNNNHGNVRHIEVVNCSLVHSFDTSKSHIRISIAKSLVIDDLISMNDLNKQKRVYTKYSLQNRTGLFKSMEFYGFSSVLEYANSAY